jgi:hypothetical protein
MGGVDLANQFRELLEINRTTNRTWWPLFYWLIGVACVNAYRLHHLYQVQLGNEGLTHLEFKVQLASRLLDYYRQPKLQYLRINLGGSEY